LTKNKGKKGCQKSEYCYIAEAGGLKGKKSCRAGGRDERGGNVFLDQHVEHAFLLSQKLLVIQRLKAILIQIPITNLLALGFCLFTYTKGYGTSYFKHTWHN
jgi:hypothetical protein